MMTKTFLLVATLAVAGFGCGDCEKSSEPKKTEAAQPAPAKEPAAPAKVDIHITDETKAPKRDGVSVEVEGTFEVK